MENKDLDNKISGLINGTKENPFNVPKNYFSEFPERLNETIKNQSKTGKLSSKVKTFSPTLKIAASIILLATITFVIFQAINNNRIKDTSIADNIELTEVDILNNMDNNSIIDIIIEDEDFLEDENTEDDEIIEYLAYNTDYSTIIDEY